MKHRMSLVALLTLLFITLGGCSSLQKYSDAQKPKARVTDVSVAAVSLSTITLNTTIRVDNPNPFKLHTGGLQLALSIAGHPLVQIEQPDHTLALPARGSADLTLPVTLAFADIYRTAADLRNQSEVPYALQGSIRLAIPVLGTVSIPLSYEDRLPVPRLPDIRLQGITLMKASFSSLQLRLDMAVSNPNRFGLNLKALDYRLLAEGKNMSAGSVSAVSLPGHSTQAVSIPFSLSLTEVGSSLFRLLTADKPLRFELNGLADIVPELGAWKPEPQTFRSEKRLSL